MLRKIMDLIFPLVIISQFSASNCRKLLKSEFVSEFIKQNFMDCTLILFRDEMLASQIFTNDLLSLLEKDVFLLNNNIVSHKHSSTEIANKGLIDVHKLRDKCVVTVISIHTISETILLELQTLLKYLLGTTKSHEDHFIFSTKEEYIESLLTSTSFGMKIKHKIAIAENANGKSVTVKTVCFYCNYGNSLLLDLTPSISNSLKFPSAKDLYKDHTKNFHGKVLQVSTPTGTKWLNEITQKNGLWFAKRGLYKLTLDTIMEKYNFSCQFFPSLGGGTGFKMPNGSWIGSVSDVLHERSELGQVTGQTVARNKVVGYTFPVSYTWLTFTTGRPKAHFSWKSIFQPLNIVVWILILISSFLVLLTLKLLIFLIAKKFKTAWDFNSIAWSLFGTFLEQDVYLPSSIPSNTIRTLSSFWFLFCIIMTTAYRSKLISFLAFPNLERIPQSFEELADSHITFGLQYLRGAAYSLLKTSTNPTYVKIFKGMELEEDEVKCFQRTFDAKFSCIAWDDIADYVNHKNLSDRTGRVPMLKAPATTCFLSVGIIMQKRSIFLSNFNFVIISAVDFGLMKRWREMDYEFIRVERNQWEKDTNRSKVNYDELNKSNTALTINHLIGSFYLVCAGHILALVAFAKEVVSHLMKKRKSRNSHIILFKT